MLALHRQSGNEGRKRRWDWHWNRISSLHVQYLTLLCQLQFLVNGFLISVIWREHLKNAQFFLKFVGSAHIHLTCKFARRYGKDCESEVHVNLS